ncbi:4-hydroxy-3-methylbut-2-enyl diphosphate reductase [Halocola ammonii]
MKSFDIPTFYRSPVIGRVKELRKVTDPRKKDFSPTILDFGPVRFLLARHFGFCFGVENAIEISYRALEENPGKRIFLLSQMIHNQQVNKDLNDRGIRFIQDTQGNLLMDWEELTPDDVVIIPAFGTTREIEERLSKMGIETKKYDTTCPFVERVWKKSKKLGEDAFTVIIHGKPNHEETRATFSQSTKHAPAVVIRDMEEAQVLAKIIGGEIPASEFYDLFPGRYSEGFDAEKDLQRVGVVNQTTMLATETQAISDHIKSVIVNKSGEENYKDHFADTRDTLCYATNDNQQATYGLLDASADFAVVVGGYNSSNTSHLVELCEEKLPTYFINSAAKVLSPDEIEHFDLDKKVEKVTNGFIPEKRPVNIVLTSGASCPDAMVDEVLQKLLSYFPETRSVEEVLAEVEESENS